MSKTNLISKEIILLNDGEEIFIGEDAHVYTDIPKQLGIYEMGLRFSDIIDMYFNEEEDK